MPLIVYAGPKAPSDPSTRYRLRQKGGRSIRLTIGIPVEVTAKQAKELRADEAHKFMTPKKADSASGQTG
jgi:hypothetical protein